MYIHIQYDTQQKQVELNRLEQTDKMTILIRERDVCSVIVQYTNIDIMIHFLEFDIKTGEINR